MKAAIRRLHSPDISDLEGWIPDSPESFGFLLQALIGPEDSMGQESFDFVVCTPDWLRRKYGQDAVLLLRNHVIVFGYDFSRIRATLEKQVGRMHGNNWQELAKQLAQIGRWEFEGYEE